MHEFGHFIVARLFKIRVEEFFIGLPGPKLIRFKKNGTTYGITAIPFGGYVRLYGELLDPARPELERDPESFIRKPWPVQIAVIAAGAFFNFLVAVFLFALMFMYGVPGEPTTTVERVLENTPAQEAGIQGGDKILKIDNVTVKEWKDLSEYVSKNPGKTVKLVVERNGRNLEFVLTLAENDGRGLLGVQSLPKMKRYPPHAAFLEGAKMTVGLTITFVRVLSQEAFKGNLLKESAGPVGIVVETSRAIKVGFDFYLFLLGLISINLGFINLLPVPPLDGGRIALILLEKTFKIKIPEGVLALVQLAGILLFAYLMVYLLISDIQRYQLIRF